MSKEYCPINVNDKKNASATPPPPSAGHVVVLQCTPSCGLVLMSKGTSKYFCRVGAPTKEGPRARIHHHLSAALVVYLFNKVHALFTQSSAKMHGISLVAPLVTHSVEAKLSPNVTGALISGFPMIGTELLQILAR